MNKAEAIQLIFERQDELLKLPEIKAKLKKIFVSEGEEAAKRFLTLTAIATLYGI